jgi:Protein of unknown function (DUF1194)
MRGRLLTIIAAAALCFAIPAARAASGQDVDVKLVLAVDASDSIENWEWKLELDGIAGAFRSAEVKELIAALPHKRIAVAMLIWGAAYQGADTTGWRLIDSAAAADRMAAEVASYPRRIGGGTAIGEGVAASLHMIEAAAYDAPRKVIDVSGDGHESTPFTNPQIMMPEARDMALAARVTINGLAIENEEPDLVNWYDEHVKTGPGAFVMKTKKMENFATAFKAKLMRELLPELSEGRGRVRTAVAN